MKLTLKRILALNLAFLMLLTLLLPVSAADESAKQVQITLISNEGLRYEDGTAVESLTYTVTTGERFDLLNRFYKTGSYVEYFEDENNKIYTTYVVPSENMTLTAHWKVTDCVTPIVFFPDQPGKDITVVNGGEEWTVPDMTGYVNSDGTVGTTFICWENKINGRWTTLLPDQTQPAADRPISYRATYLSDQTGIIFCAGDETFENNNGYSVLALSKQTTTCYWQSESGRYLTGWKDEAGNLYSATGAKVSAAETGWARLYAQWASEDAIELYIESKNYSKPQIQYALPGETVTLPSPGEINGQKFYGWDAHYDLADGRTSGFMILSGEPCKIPEDATAMTLRAYWLPEAQLDINGEKFTIEYGAYYYYYDGATGKNTANFRYDMYYANAYLYLYNYNGGPISLPCDTKVTTNEGYINTITATSGPALSCTGNLGLYSYCKDSKHASLTIKGAPNSPVLKATAGVNIDRAPHTELIAGSGGSIASDEGDENLFLLYNCYTYTYRIGTDEKNLVLKGDEGNFANLDADVTSLKIEPNTVTLTVNGNGGTSGGNGIIEKKVEAEQSISLDSLGFTKPGCYRTGYNNKVGPYDVEIKTDSYITLNWIDTGFEKFLALDLNGEKLQDVAQDHVYIDNNTGKHVLFLDYSSGKAKIPEIALGYDGSEVLYWYTAYGSKYEQADSKQFLTGETVDQSQAPEGTTLYAKGTASNWNVYLALYANGKTFSGGRRVITRSSNYLPKYTASDGANIYYYSTDPEGKADRYMPGNYADLSRGTKLYAIWLPVGSVPVTIENRANYETNETFAKAGGTITLPTPQAKDGLTFAYWSCSIRDTDGNYTWSELKAGENLPIPEKAAEVRILACWSLDKQVTVNGKSYSFAANSAYQEGDGWWIWYDSQTVKLTLTLDGYHGGSIELPVLAHVSVKSTSTINGTLSCADTLRIITECAYGQHSNLTVQAAAGASALVAPRVYFARAPHVTLTAAAGAKAIAAPTGTPEVTGNDKVTYHGKTDAAASAYTQLTMTEMGLQGVEDLQVFHTEPRMSKLTINGNGGKTTAGKTSTTVDLEYGEGYSLRATGFKKQYSDVVGFVENTGDDTYHYYEWPNSICVQSPAVTLTINWRELGFPYIAFRGNGLLTGPGVTSEVRVSYANKNEEREVLASDYVYADAVSNGDLVYWFSSEDGTETDSSRQYLAGEVVSEPDDTTLYARAIRSGQVALVAPGTTFENGKHVMVSNTLKLTTLKSKEGKTIESWNTKPDGTGRTYSFSDKLEYETPRILYAQWKTNLTATVKTSTDPTDPTVEEKVVTIEKKSDATGVTIENTEDEKPFEEAKRVILAAYENGRFVGMVNAEARNNVITCRIPKKYKSCELKLFFMKGGKPKQDMEIIRLPAEE